MYLEVFEASKYKFGWMREKPNIQAGWAVWDTGYGMKISLLLYVQNVHISTKNKIWYW